VNWLRGFIQTEATAFGYNDIISYMGPFVIRTFDTGKGQAAKDRQLAVGHRKRKM
jgi:hypothetical protein